MYRIIFDPKKCAWIIQIAKFGGLIWVTLTGKQFVNYISAIDYVDQVGLNKVYKDYRDSPQHAVWEGAR